MLFRTAAVCLLWASLAPAQAPEDLYAVTADLDRRLFDAYNRCDLDAFRTFVDPENLEFFHDHSGLSTSVDDLVDALERNICGKTRRQLEPGTLEVWPLPGYGAVQTGKHRFFQFGKDGAPDTGGTVLARFLHIWKLADGEWKLTRIVSYAH